MTHPLHDEVTPLTVLRRRASPDIEYVEVGGETVVYHCGTNGLHLLDRNGTVLWSVLDGSASLKVTSADVATAFARPADDVLDEVLRFARHLHEAGLVETVR